MAYEVKKKDEKKKGDKKGVYVIKITDNGIGHVENMLSGITVQTSFGQPNSEGGPVRNFLNGLELLSLIFPRLKPEEEEKFFKALVLLYADGFFKRGPVPWVVGEMAKDFAEGDDKLESKFAERLGILHHMHYRQAVGWKKLVKDVIAGYDILKRVAYLAHIWCFYGYNRVALHTVVRNAALIILGPLSKIYGYVTAAIWGVVAYIFFSATGFLPQWILELTVLVWSIFFGALVIAAGLPKFKRHRGSGEKDSDPRNREKIIKDPSNTPPTDLSENNNRKGGRQPGSSRFRGFRHRSI